MKFRSKSRIFIFFKRIAKLSKSTNQLSQHSCSLPKIFFSIDLVGNVPYCKATIGELGEIPSRFNFGYFRLPGFPDLGYFYWSTDHGQVSRLKLCYSPLKKVFLLFSHFFIFYLRNSHTYIKYGLIIRILTSIGKYFDLCS